jgi:hypothetical protein
VISSKLMGDLGERLSGMSLAALLRWPCGGPGAETRTMTTAYPSRQSMRRAPPSPAFASHPT